MEGDP